MQSISRQLSKNALLVEPPEHKFFPHNSSLPLPRVPPRPQDVFWFLMMLCESRTDVQVAKYTYMTMHIASPDLSLACLSFFTKCKPSYCWEYVKDLADEVETTVFRFLPYRSDMWLTDRRSKWWKASKMVIGTPCSYLIVKSDLHLMRWKREAQTLQVVVLRHRGNFLLTPIEMYRGTRLGLPPFIDLTGRFFCMCVRVRTSVGFADL